MMADGTHPVQATDLVKISTAVTRRAYEVYCHVYGKQEALMVGNCRGGFSTGELIAYLYARAFPENEWRQRVDEVFKSMMTENEVRHA